MGPGGLDVDPPAWEWPPRPRPSRAGLEFWQVIELATVRELRRRSLAPPAAERCSG
jgi:hypothetical protein